MKRRNKMAIPKVIHYCWFGRNPKPEFVNRCIESWKRICSDYIIKEWNEDNFDISKAPLYVRQAYDAKKWAFVTDYVRLWALVEHGGVYMDTDVEVIKPIDAFLDNKAFSGFEDDTHIPTGIMASQKGFPLFEEFLHYYDDKSFFDENGEISYTTNVTIMTEICKDKGLLQNNSYQIIEGFALYPNDYFCPLDHETEKLRTTKNTVTIHWFIGSWMDESKKKYKRTVVRLSKVFGRKNSENILGVYNSIKSEGFIPYVRRHIKRENNNSKSL